MNKHQEAIIKLCDEAAACTEHSLITPFTSSLFSTFVAQNENSEERLDFEQEDIFVSIMTCEMVLEIMKDEFERDIEMIQRLLSILNDWNKSFEFQKSLTIR